MLPRWVIFVSGGHMRYSKPALSVEDQARLLISRGMRGDVAEIASRLAVVSYYRLSGYWYQFRKADSDNLIDGIEFSRVWEWHAVVFPRRNARLTQSGGGAARCERSRVRELAGGDQYDSQRMCAPSALVEPRVRHTPDDAGSRCRMARMAGTPQPSHSVAWCGLDAGGAGWASSSDGHYVDDLAAGFARPVA